MLGRLLVLVALANLLGCSDDSTDGPQAPLAIEEGCNPLGAESDCLLPFPSDAFLSDGAVRIPEVAQLAPFDQKTDHYALHRPDGFSVGTPLLALLPEPINPENLVFWTGDVSASRDANSPTLLLDTETGEWVTHFAEVDPRAEDPSKQALIVRPLDRLAAGRRYVVALQGLVSTQGELLDASRAFRSLRDDGGSAHPRLAELSARYEAEVFGPLVEAGVAREGLLLAWDFTTRSDDSALGDMLAVRDDLMARHQAAPPAVSVTSVSDDVSPTIARRIELSMMVPLYVDQAGPGARLVASPPQATVEVAVPVTVWIPPSVMNRSPMDPPARLLQFGHGFFGDRYECNGFPSDFAQQHGFVVVAADWWGMSGPDRGVLIDKITTDSANLALFTDRVHQGMANFLALSMAARGPIAALPELSIGGSPAYATDQIYFYGISMGHILGGTFLALSPEIERAALGVGGANFSMMMFRARPFAALLALIELGLKDKLDQQKLAVMVQSTFDRIDPYSYAPLLLQTPLAGAPANRQLLMHTGVADSEVPNLASYAHARAIGLPALQDAVSSAPLGLGTAPAPHAGSALTVFDFGDPVEPLATIPFTPTDVHDSVRRLAASKAQLDAFFRPGSAVTHTCQGVCDPE